MNQGKRETDILVKQLDELKKNCKDEDTMNSMNKTIEYLNQRHSQENQQQTQMTQMNQDKQGDQMAMQNTVDMFENFRDRMNMIERSIEESILGDTRKHGMFRGMLDDMRKDMQMFDNNFGLDFTDNMFKNQMNYLMSHSTDLLEQYKIDEKEPEGAVGVVKHVETHTMNGKTDAKVRCEYTLKDGSKVTKEQEFHDGQNTKQIKQ